MLKHLIKYLKILISQIESYECKDINGKSIMTPQRFRTTQCVYFIAALVVSVVFFNAGFPENFTSIYANVLAILVGLFSATMLFGFEHIRSKKNKNIEGLFEVTINKGDQDVVYRINNSNVSQVPSYLKAAEIQEFNYARKFIYITGMCIVLSTLALFLILIGVLVDSDRLNLFEMRFVNKYTLETIGNFFLGLFSVIQRAVILYLMYLNFTYTLYVVGSLVQTLAVKLKR